MATPQKQVKVSEFEENFKALSGLVKDNVLLGFETVASMIEEGQKLVNAQFEQYYSMQSDYAEQLKSSINRWMKEFTAFSYPTAAVDTVLEAQKTYAKLIKDTSDRAVNNSFALLRKATENVFSTVEGFWKNLSL